LERFKRQIQLQKIGVKGQEKLKNSSVLLIGAGGLGNPILTVLASAGVGKIGVVEYDSLEISNLNRQFLFSEEDLGKVKITGLKTKLTEQYKESNFTFFDQKLTSSNAKDLISKFEIIVDATDDIITRYIISDCCKALNKILVSGAIYQFEGQVTVFKNSTENSPSLRTLFPVEDSKDPFPACEENGVLGVVPFIIGGIQANEVLKIILEIGDVLYDKLLIVNLLTYEQNIISYT
jgi:adenylyltransferase/sulfurtransferase